MLSDSKLIVTNTFNIFQTCLVMSCICAKFLHSCPTLCDPMDCSPPSSSVQGILQARTLEWVAVPSSRGSSWHRIKPRPLMSPASAGGFFTTSATWEAATVRDPHGVLLPRVSSFLCTQEKGFEFFCVSSPDISVLDVTTLILWNGKKSTCQCRRHGFNPWVRKMPWRRKWQPTPVFLPGKSHGQRSLTGYVVHIVAEESDVTYWLNSNNIKNTLSVFVWTHQGG